MNDRLEQLRALLQDAMYIGEEDAIALNLHSIYLEFEHMPSFSTMSAKPAPIPAGTYVAKIVKAHEKVSEAGNDVLVLKLALPDGRTIGSCLTFVQAAQPVINAFCDSCELVKPLEPDVAVELNASHCLGRYCYIVVGTETDEHGGVYSQLTRYLTREEALIANPKLVKVTLRQQAPLELPRTKGVSAAVPRA